ncbi:MAG: transketolase C-terminal domain-containing protein, partial [Mycobacteriales bacterium]
LGRAMFEDLGLKYVGPIDGHDVGAMETALRRAAGYGHPVIVHAITRKGYGYSPAECDEADCLHTSAAFDPETGKAVSSGGGVGWTSVFAAELVELAEAHENIVGITAAMAGPTGIEKLMRAHPDRVFDVGIAEQHAVTSAAGLAMGGMHPVVAVYSTFLNRAYDQMLLDVALHRLPVTFVLDRAGITGPDGPSHYGIWDLAICSTVPGMRVAAPRDATRLRELLREAVAVTDGPTVVRFPTGSVCADLPAISRCGPVDVLRDGKRGDVLLVAVGAFAGLGLQVAERAAEQGIDVTVVDPRWVLPVPNEIVELAAEHRLVVTVEDGLRRGGVGSAVAAALADAELTVPVRSFGVPHRFVPHGSRAQLLEDLGLTPQHIARVVTEQALRLADAGMIDSAGAAWSR